MPKGLNKCSKKDTRQRNEEREAKKKTKDVNFLTLVDRRKWHDQALTKTAKTPGFIDSRDNAIHQRRN